jgi:F-box and WD-40 domain protein 1/11
MLESDLANIKPLREYSLLATLEGHNAAVNAIQVLDSQIVSASGDRLIKIWDVKTGQCLKTISGHQKGIACVQFDGKRIVSGSSDETVRIFDRITGAEVACLRGHKNLVRTVQARFGDVPGSELEQEAEARDVDLKFFQAQLDGSLQRERITKEQRRERNAGSKDPNDIFAIGARLPPGGGGSKWARIVSGSYDESVIIWRRDVDGKWVSAHRLLQSEAVVGAGGQPRQSSTGHTAGHAVPIPQMPIAQHQMNPAATQPNFQQWLQQNGHMLTPAQVVQMQAQMAHSLQLLTQTHANTQGNALAPPQPPVSSNATSAAGPTPSTAANVGSASNATTSSANANAQTPGSTTPQSAQSNPTPPQISLVQQVLQGAVPQQWLNNLPHHPHAAQPLQAQAQGQNAGAGQPATQPAQAANAPHPHHHHHHHHHHNHLTAISPSGASSRVFKLQFDSRRIICCSQDPIIVGWDFANGDKEIEEASAFFGEDS